ncbi:hypothetical protein DBR32_02580 [Taibaiella sp. KBW10]|uniref:S8 family peptidase n=1 Tax=Taibaiella sp. KBW10 TaxID=2153357 RepID=UPI000F5967F1|nr:S8 family serine peptidase [Taibaiella sp. KBW10]RQO32506.1 hypothetical protein DBR32_02580 [Taibaiella sp. KBW10]
MKTLLQNLLVSMMLAGGVHHASAQQLLTEKGTIELKRQTVGEYRQKGLIDFAAYQKQYLLLSFDRILTAEQRKAVESIGIVLKDWYPGNGYISRMPELDKSLNALEELSNRELIPLSGITDLPAIIKISTALTGFLDQQALFGKAIMISVYDTADMPLLTEYLKQLGLQYTREAYCGDNAIVIKNISKENLTSITSLSFVASAEVYAGTPEDEWAFKLFSNQVLPVNYQYTLGASGNGVYFGNYETFGVDTAYDFNMKGRQHPQFFGTDVNGHGTSCAAIVGAANNYNEFEDRGMAPGVTSLYVDWYNIAESRYLNDNIKPMVSNHSVGWSAGQVSYNNDARQLDRITRSLGGYLHSYSAGNNGDSGPFNGYSAGWANLTGDIKVNKNNFTVHSAARPGEHHEWTNNGPTADGRLKPDVCAEGGEGSSYASPGVMGLAAILYEVYTNTYNTAPRSDVVKAVILNTAYDIDKKGIDFKTGFGTINPIRAKRTIEQQRILTGVMPQGSAGAAQYVLNVPAGTSEARFMLYWHDYQGASGAVKALVNDLDMYLVAPTGDTLRPWVLNPTPSTVYDLPLRKKDTLNNVEQVTIDNPLAGNYTVYVNGTVVPQGPQDYVLTYDMLPYHIEITNPVSDYRIPAGKNMMFTWNLSNNTAVNTDSLELYLQRNSGEAFALLATLAPDKKYYEYTIPASFPHSATARIMVKQRNQSIVDTSEYFQVMATPANLALTRICADTIGLQWDTLSNNTGGKYIIYRLGEKYMYPVDSVAHPARNIRLAATSVLGAGQQWTGTQYFAVAARHTSGALSIRSLPVSTMQTDPLINNSVPATSTLCYGDTAKLTVGSLQNDSVQWFRMGNSTVLATGTQLPRTIYDTGSYYFKTYLNNCTYTGPAYTVNAGPANIADTALWGNFEWLVSAYKDGSTGSNPYYGTNPKYYGKFRTDSLGFNSSDYYAWYSSGPSTAAGYQGCDFTSATNATTVYKRKGFTAGTYQINLRRAAGKLKMTIYNGSNTQYTSPNNAFTVNNIWTGFLDANSTIRVEAYGSHNYIEIVPLAVPLSASLKRFEATTMSNKQVALDFTLNATMPHMKLYAHQSSDAHTFERIVSSIMLLEGTHTYRMIDEHPAEGMNYYRLYWTNDDGNIQYSPVNNVMVTDKTPVKVFPTLSHDGKINVQLGAGWASTQCLITNMLGQQVSAVIVGNDYHKVISLGALPPGMYLLTLKNPGHTQVFKVIYKP